MSAAKNQVASAPEHEGATSVEMRGERRNLAVIDEAVGFGDMINRLGLPNDDAQAPPTIGRFEILGRVGAGGMSQVYKARDPDLDRLVAIKVLNRRMQEHEAERLEAEGKALAKFREPHIVTLLEVGRHGEAFFLVLEYIDGASLDVWRRSHGALGEILGVMIQVGRALDVAHKAGIIHRDVKPQNILVREPEPPARGRRGEPFAHVVDFGLVRTEGGATDGDARVDARLTATGVLVGTPLYMAPEQIDPEDPITSAMSDQYSFAVVLYELVFKAHPSLCEPLAGARPLLGPPERLMEAIRREAPRRPRLASAEERMLWSVLRRGLAKDPGARFPSMAAMVAELEAIRTWRSRWTLRGGVAAAMAMTAVTVALLLPSAAEANLGACRGRGAAITGELREGAREVDTRLRGKVEAFGGRLRDAWEVACRDEHEPGRRATAHGDPGKTRACLERAGASVQRDLKQLVAATGEERRVIAENLLLGDLPPVEECARAGSWRGDGAGALGDGERKALATAIDNARQAELLDDGPRALAELNAVSEAATRLEDWRAKARAELTLARRMRLDGDGERESIGRHLDAAKNAAIAANDRAQVVWVLLERARGDALKDEAASARAALDEAIAFMSGIREELSGDEWRRMSAVSDEVDGLIAYAEGRWEDSVGLLKNARDRIKDAKDLDDEIVRATILINLGRSLSRAGKVEEGLKVTGEAIDNEKKIFGAVHSELAEGLVGAALDLMELGGVDKAIRLLDDAAGLLSPRQKSRVVQLPLARAQQMLGAERMEQAAEYARLAERMARDSGSVHEEIQARLLRHVAEFGDQLALCEGSLDKLQELFLAVTMTRKAELGQQSDELLSQVLDARMKIALECGRFDLVLEDFEVRQGAPIESRAVRAQALAGLGRADARAALEEVVGEFRAKLEAPAESEVYRDTVLSLARLLWDGRERDAACELVRSLGAAGVDEVRTWLREHCE